MSEPYGGGAPSGDESRLDGLVGGPAALSADSLLHAPSAPENEEAAAGLSEPFAHGSNRDLCFGAVFSEAQRALRCVCGAGASEKEEKEEKRGELKNLT